MRHHRMPKVDWGLSPCPSVYVDPVKKAFLTTKDTKRHENFVGRLMSQPDISSAEFALCCHWLELRQNF